VEDGLTGGGEVGSNNARDLTNSPTNGVPLLKSRRDDITAQSRCNLTILFGMYVCLPAQFMCTKIFMLITLSEHSTCWGSGNAPDAVQISGRMRANLEFFVFLLSPSRQLLRLPNDSVFHCPFRFICHLTIDIIQPSYWHSRKITGKILVRTLFALSR
jgi:hypothetical protein